jgi:RNA polymerase sigma-70 factor (ECF subfamily)
MDARSAPRRRHSRLTAKPVAVPPDLERLFEVQGPKIHALARRLTGNAADADDLTQQTFLQAVRKWGSFEGRSDPGSWLYIIAVRLFRKQVRRKKGHERSLAPESELMPFRDRGVADVPTDAAPAINRVLDREAIESLQSAIVRLPEAFRLPLVLKDILELSVEETAEITGIKPHTVKTRVRRARLALRKEILRHVPKLPAPDPTYPRQVCIDLLAAKLDAMDRGRGFPLGREVLCDRCRAVFAELDLTQSACAALADGPMPRALRELVRRDRRSSLKKRS